MKTLLEFGEAVIKIREAINQLKIEGVGNATIILYCNQKCDEIVKAINEAAKTAPPGDVEIDLELNLAEPETETEGDISGDNIRKPDSD